MLGAGTGRSALRAAGRPSRAAASTSALAQPLPLGLLPPHPRSLRGASRLARRPFAAASRRPYTSSNSNAFALSRPASGAQRPFHACSARAAAGGLGERKGGWRAAGGKDGDGEESSSSSSDSSDSSDDDDDDDDNAQASQGGSPSEQPPSSAGKPAGAAGSATDRRRGGEGGGARDSRGTDGAAATAAAGGGDAEDGEGREYDYRSIGSEIYEDGDLEAGETMQGMYDFMDDIVETQHVPTIQDPFDHKGRFHRCPGKRQGKAALPSTCQIFDIKELHVNHTPLLKRFTNDAGMILGRYRTGLCAKCQRKVAHTIKAARQMGFVPTVSDYEIRDTGPGGLFAWAGKDGDHDAMAKAKARAEADRLKNKEKRFGSLV
eukprot:g2164.t1